MAFGKMSQAGVLYYPSIHNYLTFPKTNSETHVNFKISYKLIFDIDV